MKSRATECAVFAARILSRFTSKSNSFLQLNPLSVTYFLSASLLRHKLWAFPVSLWLIALFLLYEVFRITQTHSLILLGLICVNSVIWWLIKDEWRKTRRRLGVG